MKVDLSRIVNLMIDIVSGYIVQRAIFCEMILYKPSEYEPVSHVEHREQQWKEDSGEAIDIYGPSAISLCKSRRSGQCSRGCLRWWTRRRRDRVAVV